MLKTKITPLYERLSRDDELQGESNSISNQEYDVKHIILYADRETILKRLAKRFEGRRSWAAQQIDQCIEAFDREIPGYKIHTDGMNIYQVVEATATFAGVALTEDRRSGLRRCIDHLVTQWKHIR